MPPGPALGPRPAVSAALVRGRARLNLHRIRFIILIWRASSSDPGSNQAAWSQRSRVGHGAGALRSRTARRGFHASQTSHHFCAECRVGATPCTFEVVIKRLVVGDMLMMYTSSSSMLFRSA